MQKVTDHSIPLTLTLKYDIVASEPYSEAVSNVISSLNATAEAATPWCTLAFNMATMPP